MLLKYPKRFVLSCFARAFSSHSLLSPTSVPNPLLNRKSPTSSFSGNYAGCLPRELHPRLPVDSFKEGINEKSSFLPSLWKYFPRKIIFLFPCPTKRGKFVSFLIFLMHFFSLSRSLASVCVCVGKQACSSWDFFLFFFWLP